MRQTFVSAPIILIEILQKVLSLTQLPVRQRTVGSPIRDYIPVMRAAGQVRYTAGKLLNIKDWSFDEKEEKAREYRRTQQVYINKMVGDLKNRIQSGDETPSFLGNILRQGTLKEEEVLLASYTGSKLSLCDQSLVVPTNCCSSTVAAGVNLGYSLTWIIGYLANRPDLQQNGCEAIQEVYEGEAPKPHDFDRVDYVKGLDSVRIPIHVLLNHCLSWK